MCSLISGQQQKQSNVSEKLIKCLVPMEQAGQNNFQGKICAFTQFLQLQKNQKFDLREHIENITLFSLFLFKQSKK